MAVTVLTTRALQGAAKRRLASSSVATVPSRYERGRAGTASAEIPIGVVTASAGVPLGISASEACFSRLEDTICSDGDC